jgi:hypothetical protein
MCISVPDSETVGATIFHGNNAPHAVLPGSLCDHLCLQDFKIALNDVSTWRNLASSVHCMHSWTHRSTSQHLPNLHCILFCYAANLAIHTSITVLMSDMFACTLTMQANTNTALDQFFPDVQLHTVRDIVMSVRLSVVSFWCLCACWGSQSTSSA